jgi:predicted MPP superfamily phosphohydrolase
MFAKIGSVFALAAFFVSCSTQIPFVTRSYTLETDTIKTETLIRIALVADLHNTFYGENGENGKNGQDQKKLAEEIRNAAPDLILLAGDMMDEHTPTAGTEILLAEIRDIAPLYYVTGNHEFMSKRVAKMREIIESFGVKILSDEYEILNIKGVSVILAGIEDPYKKKYEDKKYNQASAMEKAFRALDSMDGYKILMAHRPEYIKLYEKYAFDLVVAGHAHGGQIRVARIAENGLYAPGQGIFPKYTGGRYARKNMTLIVSAGLSLTHPRLVPRVNNPPELVIIFLKAEE